MKFLRRAGRWGIVALALVLTVVAVRIALGYASLAHRDAIAESHAGVAANDFRGIVVVTRPESFPPKANKFGDPYPFPDRLFAGPAGWVFFDLDLWWGKRFARLLAETAVFGTVAKAQLNCSSKVSVTAATDTVYAVDDCGFVYRFDRDGDLLQTVRLEHDIEAPPAVTGHWLMINAHGSTYVLDRNKLTVAGRAVNSWSETRPLFIADDGEFGAIVADASGWLRRLTLAAGRLSTVWRYETGSECESSPVLIDGNIWQGCHGGKLHIVDPATGTSRLVLELPGDIEGGLTVAARSVFVPAKGDGSTDGGVVARVDRRTFAIDWKTELSTGIETQPVECAGALVAAGNSQIVALDANNGRTIWRYASDGRVESDPLCDRGKIWVPTHKGILHRIDASSGQSDGRFYLGSEVWESGPVLVRDDIWVATMSGTIFRFSDGPAANSHKEASIRGAGSVQ